MVVGVSRDTALCIHSPMEIISKDAWLSHFSMEGKDTLNMWLYVTGAYHVNGKNECIRKIGYSTDTQYMLLAHAEPIHPNLIPDARKTGADIVFCGKHVWFDIKKVVRLTPPWFGPDWSTAFDYLKDKAEANGLKTATIDIDPWIKPEGNDFSIDYKEGTPETVDVMIPCSWDFVPLRFWSSMATMELSRVSRFLICGEDDIVASRNRLVKAHLDGKSGYSMFFDVDMAFPSHTINQLLAHNKDIVGGTYYQRQIPFYPHLYENLGTYDHPRSKRIVDISPFMEVDSLGTGCLLVKRNVYESIGEKPYELRYITMDTLVGEDIGFCVKAKKNGFKIFADSTMDIVHIGNINVTPEEARKYKPQWRPM